MSNKLSTRIAALTGPCREIDAEISVQFGNLSRRPGPDPDDPDEEEFIYCQVNEDGGLSCPGRNCDGKMLVPHYTSSLDAITQLIDKEFPEGLRGCEQYYLHDDPAQGIAGFEAHCNLRFGEIDRGLGTHGHEAIAYCIAYSKAKEANNETDS